MRWWISVLLLESSSYVNGTLLYCYISYYMLHIISDYTVSNIGDVIFHQLVHLGHQVGLGMG